MKSVESKTTTAAQHLQAKAGEQQPFFQQQEERPGVFFGNDPPAAKPFFTPFIQRKLTIGQPGDKYEQEADAMADVVVQSLSEPQTIQPKCADCAEEEKLQKKDGEEELMEQEESIQRKPIFESNEEPPAGQVQRKCETCEATSLQPLPIQQMSSREKAPSLQAQSGPADLQASFDLESRLNATKGAGSPLPEETRSSMGSAFGTDFSGVRVHTNSTAVQMNQELGAQAFTHGSDVYFNAGKYSPGSREGQRLLGHELTHVVQQGGILKIAEKSNKEVEARPEGIVSRNEQVLQRNGGGNGKGQNDNEEESLYPQHKAVFERMGINIHSSDLNEVGQQFPEGVNLIVVPLYVTLGGTNYAQGYRIRGFKVEPVRQITSQVQSYIFQVGKGRAILVSSPTGGSIMFDAGAQNRQVANRLAESLTTIFRTQLASPPSSVIISHTDTDHINALQRLLEIPEMRRTAIEIAKQQLRSAVGQRDWNRSDIQLDAAQKVIEIKLKGEGVSTHRRIIGNMQITEFRLESAHRGLSENTNVTYNKNASSPVTVVRDLVSGQVQVFTADAPGTALQEIVQSIGSEAFRRILGGGGQNLRLVEIPHHGGKVSGNATVGMLNFLRLSFEASRGDIRFFTQTNQSFSGKESASINHLDASEISTQRITGEEATGSKSNVVRASGSDLEQITLNRGQIEQIFQLGQTHETSITRAYGQRAKIVELQENAKVLIQVLSETRGKASQIHASLTQIKREIDTQSNNLNQRLNQYWEKMAAASSESGMRSNTNRSEIQNEVKTLNGTVAKMETSTIENSINAHVDGLNTYERIFRNVIQMYDALNKGEFSKLQQLKSEQRGLIASAAGFLGAKEVRQHVRSTWRNIRSFWTGRTLRSVSKKLGYISAQRRMMTDYRTSLAESLGRQIRLNQTMEAAMHGTLPRSGSVPARTRTGASVLAAIEVIRIGLELAEAIHFSQLAEEQRASKSKAHGIRDVYWWQYLGVTPSLKLVQKGTFYGYNDVTGNLSDDDILKIITDQYSGEVPEYERVVVSFIKDSDLQYVMGQLSVQLIDLSDWVNKLGNPLDSGGWFWRSENKWYVRMWSMEEEKYIYYKRNVVQEPLEKLYNQLWLAQSDEFERKKEEEQGYSVKDTAWFGTDRYVYVYTSIGTLKQLDFEDFAPKFTKLYKEWVGPFRKEMQVVIAANMSTYTTLSRYYWRKKGQEYMTNTGNYWEYFIFNNHEGKAYVDTDDIVKSD